VRARQQAEAVGDVLGLGETQRRVYNVVHRSHEIVKNPDATNMEIARVLNWEVNRVTPRVHELRERGLVVGGRRRACSVTGRVVQAWRAADPDPRYSVNPCVRAYGFGPPTTRCATCSHLFAPNDRHWYKCELRGVTSSPESDHRKGWPACSKYRTAV
jgi:hypothetical protein